jgi:arsenate reductase
MEIWINPACSKCRSAISLLDAEGASYTVRRYLEDVPTEEEIRGVLGRLGLEPWDITRTQEAAAKLVAAGANASPRAQAASGAAAAVPYARRRACRPLRTDRRSRRSGRAGRVGRRLRDAARARLRRGAGRDGPRAAAQP